MTTAEIERTLRVGYAPREYNHHVAQALPVAHRARQLPLDPYVLGAWLGDGTATKPEITCADEAILAEIARAGISVQPGSGPIRYWLGGEGRTRDPVTGRYTGNGSLCTLLRTLGLTGNKHIPDIYLLGGIAQRRALLAGLMDTDGYVDRLGRCDLTTIRRGLADQCRELVASLGFKPVIACKRAMLYGMDCGPKYEVTFTPHEPVFRLQRKLARQKTEGRFKMGRGIFAVDRVPNCRVRSVRVASATATFLVSQSFIPTYGGFGR